jgi:hypothetical protein
MKWLIILAGIFVLACIVWEVAMLMELLTLVVTR